MSPTLRPLRPGEAPTCERILRALPGWFGIEESIIQYAKDVAAMETVVAEVSGIAAGFLTIKRHKHLACG